MKTGAELVAFARSKLGCGYIYGSSGQVITEAFLLSKARQYPGQYSAEYLERSRKWIGHVAYDCSGLVDACLGVDYSAQGYYTNATSKARIGSLADIPRDAGLLLFKMDSNGHVYHIGVYDGNGRAIEARGVDYGVIERSIDSNWTHWGHGHLIDYGGTINMLLKVGSTGEEVKTLQANLNAIGGYGLVVDGQFGAKTDAAVRDFQSKHGLTVDGIAGDKTLAAIAEAIKPPVIVAPPAPDYAGQLAEKVEKITFLTNEISAGQKRVEELTLQVDQLAATVSDANARADAATGDLRTLAGIIKKYEV